MSLAETISNNFQQILEENGTEVTNLKTNTIFKALVTSGDFIATFIESDQQTELSIQLTTFSVDAPKTGELLKIDQKRYIVQTVTTRTNSPLTKVTAYETKKNLR